jgi:hypothetical protein
MVSLDDTDGLGVADVLGLCSAIGGVLRALVGLGRVFGEFVKEDFDGLLELRGVTFSDKLGVHGDVDVDGVDFDATVGGETTGIAAGARDTPEVAREGEDNVDGVEGREEVLVVREGLGGRK